MKQYLAAIGLIAALAPPATAVTFPSLTTIYVGAGVINTVDLGDDGLATSFHCINVSGLTATIRYLVLNTNGTVAGSITRNAAHGATITASTHETATFGDSTNEIIPGSLVFQGGINIESTESGVFCTAMILDASVFAPSGIDLHLVRVNAHPGTVE